MSGADFNTRQSTDEALVAFAFEQLTVTSAEKKLTQAVYVPNRASGNPWPTDARRAFITIEGADMRYRMDGVAATASVGHFLADGASLTVNGVTNIENFSAFRDAGVDVTLSVTYSR